jgi:hypothetical protein
MPCGPLLEQMSVLYNSIITLRQTYHRQAGHVNLFTLRHEPGRLCHVMNGHRGPVSALALDYDDKGFFSAGWDGEAIVSGPTCHTRTLDFEPSP